jgi:hypothetical protein
VVGQPIRVKQERKGRNLIRSVLGARVGQLRPEQVGDYTLGDAECTE